MALGDMANSCIWMLTLVACDEDRNGRRNALVREQEKDAVTASTWALQLDPPWQMRESLLVAPWKLQKTHPQSSIIWTLKKRLLMSANITLKTERGHRGFMMVCKKCDQHVKVSWLKRDQWDSDAWETCRSTLRQFLGCGTHASVKKQRIV